MVPSARSFATPLALLSFGLPLSLGVPLAGGLGVLAAAVGCSSEPPAAPPLGPPGGAGMNTGAQGAAQSPGALPEQSAGAATGTAATGAGSGFIIDEEGGPIVDSMIPTTGTEGNEKPINLGSEIDCDGIDENNNGILDDVDIGKDGLCDCINLGFFGQIASDAGDNNAAFVAWLEERAGEVPVKQLDATETLTAEWLASLQVLIVGGLQARAAMVGTGAAFAPEEIAAFDDWLQNRGAGVFTLSGYTDDSNDARPTQELLANTGLGYELATVPAAGVITTTTGGPPAWLGGIVAPEHPSVEGVSEIGVFYGYPVSGDGTVILREDTYDLAIAKGVGNGRAFVFADEWITQDVTWAGTVNGQTDPCQQPCNEQASICRIASEQCANCELQPCSDPLELDAATCEKGCQGSCDSETARCEMYTQQCATCSAGVIEREQQTPRLWLNTIRWLTPVNECQVDIPPIIRVR
jgi:hypothetical protein